MPQSTSKMNLKFSKMLFESGEALQMNCFELRVLGGDKGEICMSILIELRLTSWVSSHGCTAISFIISLINTINWYVSPQAL